MESMYSKWDVTHDDALEADGVQVAPNQFLAAVELISPALIVRMEATAQVEKVLKIMSSGFDIKTKSTCGFHVHLSNSSHLFSLNTIRNLGMIQAVFNRQLNNLHPPSRVPRSWCCSPSRVWSTHCRTRQSRMCWLRWIPHDVLELDILIETTSPKTQKGHCVQLSESPASSWP